MSAAERNKNAVLLLKSGDAKQALLEFSGILDHWAKRKLCVQDLHVCLGNRSAAYLALNQPRNALNDALDALQHLEKQCAGVPARRVPGYSGVLRRIGNALAACGKLKLAQDAYEEGLIADPSHLGCRKGLQAVIQAVKQQQHQHPSGLASSQHCPATTPTLSQQLSQGRVDVKGAQASHLAIPVAANTVNSAAAAVGGDRLDANTDNTRRQEVTAIWSTAASDNESAAGIVVDDLSRKAHYQEQLAMVASQLPHMPLAKQMTVKEAQVDVLCRDTLNYLTIQSDLAVPRHILLHYLQDAVRMSCLADAVQSAVQYVTQELEVDCRVMVVGSGLGVVPLIALAAGAVHVTVIDRWMYAAASCKDMLEHHAIPADQYTVLYGQVADMKLGRDVPVCCNLVISEALLDPGLLTSGWWFATQEAVQQFTTKDAIVIPRQLDVYCQAVEVSVPCPDGPHGIDLSALDGIRGQPLLPGATDKKLPQGVARALTEPVHVWTWNSRQLRHVANSEIRHMPLPCILNGKHNAMLCWYEATLYGNIKWTTHDEAILAGDTSGSSAAAASGGATTSTEGVTGDGMSTSSVQKDVTGGFSSAQEDATGGAGGQQVGGQSSATHQHDQHGVPTCHCPSVTSAQTAVHFLSTSQHVARGCVLAVTAVHNKSRISFIAHCEATGQQLCEDLVHISPSRATAGGSHDNHDEQQHVCTPRTKTCAVGKGTRDWHGDVPRTSSATATLHRPCYEEVLYEPSLPRSMFAAASDVATLTSYGNAIQRAVQQLCGPAAASTPAAAAGHTHAAYHEFHVLDVRSQSGALGIMAAKQPGVASVTSVNAHPVVAQVAARNAALSGVSDKVTVVPGAVKDVVPGVHTPKQGCNLLLLDIHDADLLSSNALGLAQAAARNGLLNNSTLTVLPCKAVVYCMGVQILASHPGGSTGNAHEVLSGISLAPLNRYRRTGATKATLYDAALHKPLTPVFALWQIDFTAAATGQGPVFTPAAQPDDVNTSNSTGTHDDASGTCTATTTQTAAELFAAAAAMNSGVDNITKNHAGVKQQAACGGRQHIDQDASGRRSDVECFVQEGRGGGLMIQQAVLSDGILNAVVMWYDLHLSDDLVITTAPPSYGCAGRELSVGGGGGGGDGHGTIGTNQATDTNTRVINRMNIGQALRYTDHVAAVRAGQAVQLVAQRSGNAITVDLRPSKAQPAPRPPWMEEWGGGVSIENPHVQRAKYCDLITSDLLQRLPCGRGPSVTADVQAIAAHCGSLQLFPPAVRESLRHLSLLERLYRPGMAAPSATPNIPHAAAFLGSSTQSWAEDTKLGSSIAGLANRWRAAVLADDDNSAAVTDKPAPGRRQTVNVMEGPGRGHRMRHVRVAFSPEVVPYVHWDSCNHHSCVFEA